MSTPQEPSATRPVPGWYPDPSAPAGRTGRRWWDGNAWTDQVQADPVPAYGAAHGGTGFGSTTPDGQPLAGWWQRVGAYLLDGLVLIVPIGVLTFPFWRTIVSAYSAFLRQTVDAANNGVPGPSSSAFMGDVRGSIVGVALVSLVVQVAYQVLFLRWKGATPGKLAVGLRVRRREAPGQLPWPVIARHAAGQYVYVILTAVPLVGFVGSIYPLLDVLWAAWDGNRQTLHDKLAKTNVVRVR